MIKRTSLAACTVLSLMVWVVASAAGDPEAGKEKSKACAACHGVDGNSVNPIYPSLAGQVPGYIADQLAAYKSKRRQNEIMAGMAAALSDQDMANLDAYYASQKIAGGAVSEQEQVSALRGERLYRGGYAPMQIAACMSCHGPSGHGVPRRFPRVAGQQRQYLETQLLAFKAGKRKGYLDIMARIAFRLSEQQIKDLAAYMYALN